jgi:hypothetical protein
MSTYTNSSQTSTSTPSTSTWRIALQQAGLQKDEARANTKEAGQAAWAAARAGIEEWLTVKGADPEAQAFHGEVLRYYGKARKGEASKIRTIALATANNVLDPNAYRTLGAAYAAALKLTKIADVNATEDAALAASAAALAALAAASAPTGTPESMASTIMALGAKKAVTLMLDALGEDNLPAHRALLRELSKQVGERNEKAQAKTTASTPAKDKTVPKADVKPAAPAKPAKTKPAPAKPAKADVKPAVPVKVKTAKTKTKAAKPAKVA